MEIVFEALMFSVDVEDKKTLSTQTPPLLYAKSVSKKRIYTKKQRFLGDYFCKSCSGDIYKKLYYFFNFDTMYLEEGTFQRVYLVFFIFLDDPYRL